MWYVYTVQYYLAVKRNIITGFAGNRMEAEIIVLDKV